MSAIWTFILGYFKSNLTAKSFKNILPWVITKLKKWFTRNDKEKRAKEIVARAAALDKRIMRRNKNNN